MFWRKRKILESQAAAQLAGKGFSAEESRKILDGILNARSRTTDKSNQGKQDTYGKTVVTVGDVTIRFKELG